MDQNEILRYWYDCEGGRFRPGDRLKEMHIAKSSGVSQAPVREAIRSFEAIGYIEHVPNVGAWVKTFSTEKLGLNGQYQ